jgi:hypothetical protein
MTSQPYSTYSSAETITAADVHRGDVIAGGNYRNKIFAAPDAFRTVREVTPGEHPGDQVIIRYTTARGSEFTRRFDAGQPFFRIPAMPELPEPSELEDVPEQMNDQDRKRAERDRETYAALTAESLLANDLKAAHHYAKQYREAAAIVDADQHLWHLKSSAEAFHIEEAGGHEHDTDTHR